MACNNYLRKIVKINTKEKNSFSKKENSFSSLDEQVSPILEISPILNYFPKKVANTKN